MKPGGERLERTLHARFANFRSHGEWFNPSEELLAEMENA
ncbi:GIY-YIG nuclease family protein [Bacillus cereus]